jgi:WD40 repeat protein
VSALREEQFEPQAQRVHRTRIAMTLQECLTPCGPIAGLDETLPISPDPRLVATDWRVLVRTDAEAGRTWALKDHDGNTIAEFHHPQRIITASLSPDGQRVVTASEDGTARVWNARTGQPVTPPLKHDGSVLFAAFSPDSHFVVTASADNTARVWDAASGEAVSEPLRHEADVEYAAFSPDGKLVATAGGDNVARVWNANGGKSVSPPIQHPRPLTYVIFSPDGKRILTVCEDHAARVFDARTGEGSGAMLKQQAAINSAVFSPDSRLVVTAGQDSTVCIWQADTGKPVGKPIAHADWVWHASFSPNSDSIVTACRNGAAQIYDVKTGAARGPRIQHRGPVRAAVFSPDGRRLITEVWDMGVFAWNVPERFAPVPEAALEFSNTDFASFDRDGLRVLVQTGRQFPTLVDARGGQTMATLDAQKGQLSHADFEGDLFATASDTSAIVWDAGTVKPLFPPLPHDDSITRLALAPDRLVTVTRAGIVRAWNPRTGKPLTAGVAPTGGGEIVAISPDGRRYLAITSDGKTAADIKLASAIVYDTDTGQAVSHAMKHAGMIHFAAFSHDGKLIVTASNDHTARLWNAQTGQPTTEEPLRHGNPVFHAAFSPDDTRIVTGSQDHTARVWDVGTGHPLTPPMLHEGPCTVRRVAFSPDGAFVATATDYYAARVWDARTGQPVSDWLAHAKQIEQIAFSPDSKRLLAIDQEHKLRVWNVAPDLRPIDDLAKFAQLLSGRRLDETGGESPLGPRDFANLAKELSAAYPGSFLPPATKELAEAALASKELDPALLAPLGDWLAANRLDDQAVRLYQAARDRGQKVDPQRLAYSSWRAGENAVAIEAFGQAMTPQTPAALRAHFLRCLDVLQNHRVAKSASTGRE